MLLDRKFLANVKNLLLFQPSATYRSCYFIETRQLIILLWLDELSLIFNDYDVENDLCRDISFIYCFGIHTNIFET